MLSKLQSLFLLGVVAFFLFLATVFAQFFVLGYGYGLWMAYIVTAIAIGIFIIIALAVFDLVSEKTLKRISLGLLSVSVLAVIANLSYQAYVEDITIASDRGVNLEQYEPFSSGNVATLEAPASFSVTENLPKLDGATALYPVYSAFVQATYPEDDYSPFDRQNSPVVSTQTDIAYERLIAKNADIIFVAGPSASQINLARNAGVEMELTPIGREAFVFFTHHSNPIDSLTIEEIQGIYSGEITNWNEVGGNNYRIRAFQRPEESGSQTALQNLMGDIPIMDAPTEDRPAGMGGIIQETADYRNSQSSIGFSFRYFSTEMVDDYDIKHLEVNGVYPDIDTIRDDSYPIASEFYAVTLAGEKTPEVEALMEWILSPEGQTLVEQSGYVPVGATE